MAEPALSPELVEAFSDRAWRIDNLYYVQDEYGAVYKFKMRPAQRALLDELHYLNIILKARQLGFSTLILLIALDCCIWNDHFAAGLIADTRKNAENLLVRVKFAYDNLPEEIQQLVPLLASNSTEMRFANGSSIEVGVSLRSSTKNFLHISEYGKICAKQPDKAKEVRSGTLNTLAPRQLAFIESTAEGKGGDFFDKVQQARAIQDNGREPADMEWKFHFFPWWQDAKYTAGPVDLTDEEVKYFVDLEKEHGITLSAGQEFWYALKWREQGDDMLKEYPSTPDEAFAGATDGAIFGKQMRAIRQLGNVGVFKFVPGVPVNTFWDFGLNDMQTIWLHQEIAGRHRFVGYIENNNIGTTWYVEELAKWRAMRGAVMGRNFGPHDLEAKRQGRQVTTLRKIFAEDGFPFEPAVARNPSKVAAIQGVRRVLSACDFDEGGCAKGIAHLEAYSWVWDDNNSVWLNEPRHDEASHGADGFMTFSDGYKPESRAAVAPVIVPAARSLQGSVGR
jgi:hypothetical protein